MSGVQRPHRPAGGPQPLTPVLLPVPLAIMDTARDPSPYPSRSRLPLKWPISELRPEQEPRAPTRRAGRAAASLAGFAALLAGPRGRARERRGLRSGRAPPQGAPFAAGAALRYRRHLSASRASFETRSGCSMHSLVEGEIIIPSAIRCGSLGLVMREWQLSVSNREQSIFVLPRGH